MMKLLPGKSGMPYDLPHPKREELMFGRRDIMHLRLRGTSTRPWGNRFRLKAEFDLSAFDLKVRVILLALKKYGMILADNGASWFISGVPDERWDNDVLHQLHQVRGSDFEAVDSSTLMIDPNSGRAKSVIGCLPAANLLIFYP